MMRFVKLPKRKYLGAMMNNIPFLIILLLVAFFAGASGFFAGKSIVFERILDDKIECSLTINPITMEKLQ